MKTAIFYGTIDSGKLTLDNQELLRVWLKSHKKPLRVQVCIEPIERHLTDQQRKYFYGVIVPAFMDYCGYSKNEIAGVLKRLFLTVHRGTKKEYVKSLTELNVAEMSAFIDECSLCAAEIGIILPPIER